MANSYQAQILATHSIGQWSVCEGKVAKLASVEALHASMLHMASHLHIATTVDHLKTNLKL